MPAIAAPPPTTQTTTQTPSSPPPGSAEGIGSHEPSPENYLGDIGDELSQLDSADETAKRAPERQRDPVTKKFVKAEEKPAEPQDKVKAPETPKEVEKPVEEPPKSNIRALGKAYDALKKERDEVYQPKIQSLEAKTKEYERTIEELKKSTPDPKPWQEKLAAAEKENASLREAIRYADYRKSPEFTDKYEKPYNEAWAKAVYEITQLSAENEDGTFRKATENDILALANSPLDKLDETAAKWFPRSAARVIRHIEKIRELADQQDKALEEAKKGAGEFQTKRMAESQKMDETFRNTYQGTTAELTKKYPKWFAPDETDPKGNEMLKKGFDFADTVFSSNGNLTPEQKASRLAVIRAKAANHDRVLMRLKARDARVVELEAELAKFEGSEPPVDGEGSPDNGTASADWRDEVANDFKKLDR